jgi:hypothetical protein
VKLAPIVAQLEAAGLKRVQGALELAALKTSPAMLPAFFVVPMGEDAAANRLSGVHDQATTRTFGVVIIVEGRSAERSSDLLADLEARVLQALAGWTHPEASRPCDYASGRMLSVSGSTVSWLVSFRTGRHIRKANQ